MSFILEALRKSESERQRLSNASIADLPAGRRTRKQPWWVIAIAVLLLINLIVLIAVLVRDRVAPGKEEPQKSAQTYIAPAAPAVASPTPGAGANVQANAAPAVATPALAASRPLSQVAAPSPQVAYETVPRTEMEIANARASVPDGPTLVRPVEPPPNSASPTTPAANSSSMQDIHLDLHVYSPDRRESFVMINMHRYTEGQRLLEGPLLEKITPEGVLLNYNGSHYNVNRN